MHNSNFYLLFIFAIPYFKNMLSNLLSRSFSSSLDWYLNKNNFLFRETGVALFLPYCTGIYLLIIASKCKIVCFQL